MNKIKRFFRFIVIIVSVWSIVSCSVEKGTHDYFDEVTEYCCGTYMLDEIVWNGPALDINGDGKPNSYLLAEFRGMPGFVEQWIKAEVRLGTEPETLVYDVVVPVVYMFDNERYYFDYFGMIMDVEWSKWPNDTDRYPQYHVSDIFHPVIPSTGEQAFTSATVRIKEDSFDVVAYCPLPDSEGSPVEYGAITYSFKKY